MMVGKVVLSHSSILHMNINNSTIPSATSDIYNATSDKTQIEIATAVTFMVALMQVSIKDNIFKCNRRL
jgi:hypothetical protein